MRHFTRWLPIVLLPLLLLAGNCLGQFEEGRAGGTQPTLIPLSTIPTPVGMGMATYNATTGSTSRRIKNVVWFKINEQATMPNGRPMFFKSPFTATVTFEVTTVDKNNVTTTQTGKTLTVNYETDPTKTYTTKNYWALNPNDYDGYSSVTVKATYLNISGFTNWDIASITGILSLENQMQVLEYFQSPTFLPPNFSVPGYDAAAHPDILSVSWAFPTGATNNMCQLEYAYVEDETAAYYMTSGQLDYNRLFLNNSTRVDITTNGYNIPMLYDGAGKLYYRVRPTIRRNTGSVETGNWTTPQVYPQSGFYPGHEPTLNWQATTSFAEEQKSKTVVQYFDGTLRGRQTVTKDNSTGNTVVAETIYDLQGRPNVQILPTPTLGTAVMFFRDFNRFDGMGAASDNPANYFDLSVAGAQCNGAPKLQTTQGNGQYYSPNNPWNPSPTNPNSEADAAFVPDAQGYAYTETKLMDDPTGRVEAQGGVGINHQLGSGHETRYFYGKPDQDELDAVFGTEVGYAEHYFKNMVLDANGQMSVSYTDMHGRTVATALAGEAPASGALKPIKDNAIYYPSSAGRQLTKNLVEPDNNTVKGHSIESINTLLVPKNTTYNFIYDLKPDVYQKSGCSQSLCFDCKYDLEITIRKEGCDNGTNGPTAFTYRYNNLAPVPSGQCGTPMLFVGGNIDGTKQVTIPSERITIDQNLSVGSWTVTKTLTINEAAFQARHDIALNAFLCETEQDITNTIFAASGCDLNIPTATINCNACNAMLGTSFNNAGDPTSYVQRYLGYMSLPVGATLDVTSIADLRKQYDADVLSCGLTCGTAADPRASPMAGIRQQMLRDMIPYSGQFALATEDPAAHSLSAVFNIFGNTTAYNGIPGYSVPTAPHPLYKNPSDNGASIGTYRDEDLFADPNMTPAILANTTPDLFVNAFSPSWANQLIGYHPEYQKLLLAEGVLKPSFDYAQAFQSCTTYALANSSPNNFLHPLASDPYFTYVPADNSKMDSYLNVGTSGITIWSLANAAALCPTDISTTDAQNARGACIKSMPNTVISTQITTTADLDNFWETFKGLYLGQRNNLAMTYINTQSTASSSLPSAAMAQLIKEGKSLHFLNNADAANQGGIGDFWAAATATPQPDMATLTNLGNARAGGQNAKVCAALKPLWKSELQQCEGIQALIDQDTRNDNSNNQATVDGILNNITNQMEQVCLLSIDANNPNGASEASPPNMLASPNSFEQIVRTAFANAGMSPITNGNFLCNPYTINVPKPYGKNVPNADTYSPSISSCNCDQWAKVKTEIAAATTGGPYDITSIESVNSYLLANHGDVLSPGLWNGLQQCNGHGWQKTVCYTTSNGTTNTGHASNNGDQTCYTVPNPITIGTDKNPVYIPIFLGCGYIRPCMSCVQLAQYTADFVALYPFYLGVPFIIDANTTDVQQGANSLWARYINYKTGFSLTASVYATALLSCGYSTPIGSGPLCVSDLQLSDRSGQPPTTATPLAQYTASTIINFLPGYSSQDNDNFIAQIVPCDGSGGSNATAIAVCCNTFAANHVPVNLTSTVSVNPCQKQLDDAAAAAHQIIALRATYYKAQFDAQYLATCLGAQGHELFTAAYTPSEYHYTLYYYNQAGNLVKTVPPAGVRPNYDPAYLAAVKTTRDGQQPAITCPTASANCVVATTASGTYQLVPAHTLATNYRHNSLDQAVAQNSPDGGTSQYWYDRLGRLAVSQNAKQAAAGNYSYTLYDPLLGRINEVGQKPLVAPFGAMAQFTSQDPVLLDNWINGNPANKQQMTRTTYDQAYGPGLAPYIVQQNLRNRVSYTEVWDNGSDPYARAATYYTYDIHGNVDNLLQDYGFYDATSGQGIPNPMNNSGNRFKKLSYSYDLISGKVNQVAYQPPLPDQLDPTKTNPQADAFYHRYSYDAENRLAGVETSRDNLLWTRDARYQYYRHGPLARTELGDLHVQGVDYAYTIQGWMKGINPSATGGDADGTTNLLFARDAYTLSLNYFNGDFAPISGVPLFGQATLASQLGTNQRQLFNGNIGSMAVNLPKLGSPMLYNYGYDQLNRIVSMDALKATDASFASLTAIQDYAERYTYDPNGNIMSLIRNGTTAQGLPMDNLSYRYVPNTNQLDHVEDAVAKSGYATDITTQTVGNYAYDPIGNMVSDIAGGITGINWTVYGKIQSVAKASGTVNYTYDASGNRISKTVGGTTTWYVRDATGNVMTTYTSGDNTVNSGHLTQKELDLYGSSRLGLLNTSTDMTAPVSAIAAYTRNQKIFELTNHLGNVLATVTDVPLQVQDPANLDNVQYYNANIASANDYYPFGMVTPGRSFSAGSQYRYGFNGKEDDKDISNGAQDYGMRINDVRIGRFLSVDPLTPKYPELTPYQFGANRPIDGIDEDGLEWAPTIDKKGNTTDYSWVGYNSDGSAKAGSVASAFLNKGTFSYSYGSDANNKSGSVFVASNTHTATSNGWWTDNRTKYDYSINIDGSRRSFRNDGYQVTGHSAEQTFDGYNSSPDVSLTGVNGRGGETVGAMFADLQSALGFHGAPQTSIEAVYPETIFLPLPKLGLLSESVSLFRAMSYAEYDALKAVGSGGLSSQAGKELFVSTMASYSRTYLSKPGYDVLVEFTMEKQVMSAMAKVGVEATNSGVSKFGFKGMSKLMNGNWMDFGKNLFKVERGVLNVGLGYNPYIFNAGIKSFKLIN